MRVHRFLATLLLFATVLFPCQSAFAVPQSCTVFMISDGIRALGGGNEDQGAFPARAWFIPASEGKFGRVYFGFEHVVESGMNDQGLFYDSLSAPTIEVDMEEGKEIHRGMWTLRALETCSDVEEVASLVERIAIPGTWTDKLFFGDSNGNSIIVEGKQILRPVRNYQISTNFAQSTTPPSEITCDRYLTAREMLNAMELVSLSNVREVFEATSSTYPDGAGTAYTTIYEPISKTITAYLWRDFEHAINFDLEVELAKGAHVVELANLLPMNARREPWVAAAQAELNRLIESRIDPAFDLTVIDTGLVGHYEVAPEVGFLPSPPVMIDGASVVWANGAHFLVVVPEGISFELLPGGNDVWFHTNITMKPEMDFVLQRGEQGDVVGANLALAGIGEIPFIKTSSEPQYEPLPTNPLPTATEVSSSILPVVLAAIAGILVAVALALLLRD